MVNEDRTGKAFSTLKKNYVRRDHKGPPIHREAGFDILFSEASACSQI